MKRLDRTTAKIGEKVELTSYIGDAINFNKGDKFTVAGFHELTDRHGEHLLLDGVFYEEDTDILSIEYKVNVHSQATGELMRTEVVAAWETNACKPGVFFSDDDANEVCRKLIKEGQSELAIEILETMDRRAKKRIADKKEKVKILGGVA